MEPNRQSSYARPAGMVFNIMHYSVHDGPGLRTTLFLKGCPLRCTWCHNPEGEITSPEIAYRPDRCLACGDCVRVCPSGALHMDGGGPVRLSSRCRLCGACIAACTTDAIEMIGREMTLDQVMEEILSDRPFYEESGGGVSFSGGEPLMQPDFLLALLEECKKEEIHTVVDTSGAARFGIFERILPLVDLFLYDLKLIDEERHEREIGSSNHEILENLRRLSEQGAEILIRVPVVPGVNDDEQNVRAISRFLASLPLRPAVQLLPYHDAGERKRQVLGRDEDRSVPTPPSQTTLERAAGILREQKLLVKIGA